MSNMITKKLFSAITVLLFTGAALFAQDYKYVGAPKCKLCHNKPATGNQYAVWQSKPHANAMKSLSSDKSMEYAKTVGIADPTKDMKCLKCHSTFYAIDASMRGGINPNEGVSCETCHGPGSKYKTQAIMESREASLAAGLILPDKAVCEKCHNKESPFYKPFNYTEALKTIAHPNPAK